MKARLPLVDGDRIQICYASFVLHKKLLPVRDAHARGEGRCATVMFSPDTQENGAIIHSALDAPSGLSSSTASVGAEARVRALLEIMHSIGNALDLEKVLPSLLDGLFRIFAQADRGFIIMKDEQGELQPRWTKLRQENDDETLCISRSIIEHVLSSKGVVLSEDAACDHRFDTSKSIFAYQIHTTDR